MSAAIVLAVLKTWVANPLFRRRGGESAKRCVKVSPTAASMAINSPDPEKKTVRFEILDAVMRAELDSSLKGTLLALAYHENKDGQWVWPKLETLAGESGLNRKTVVKSLAELIAIGLIDRESRTGTSSQYRLRTQPILGLTQFRADPNQGQGVAQIRADTQPKNGPLTSPGDPSKDGSTPAAPSASAAEARRLLGMVSEGNRPHIDDQHLLSQAASGSIKAWNRFRSSTEGATRRFLRRCARGEAS